jgi:large subunit ribosomal protein L25
MAEITLQAELGRTTGSRASNRLRASGRVPATVYGLGRDPQTVSVAWRELRAALVTEAGLNVLVDLEVDGHTDLVMVKDLQRHPVRRDVLHVDFLRVDRDELITVEVPIHLHGEAEAVIREEGLVDPVLNSLTISAKPGDIPNEIVIDVSGMAMGDIIHVRDVQLPAGVTTTHDPDEALVVTSTGAAAELEEIEAADAEAAAEAAAESGEGAPAEGEAGESAEGGDEAAPPSDEG